MGQDSSAPLGLAIGSGGKIQPLIAIDNPTSNALGVSNGPGGLWMPAQTGLYSLPSGFVTPTTTSWAVSFTGFTLAAPVAGVAFGVRIRDVTNGLTVASRSVGLTFNNNEHHTLPTAWLNAVLDPGVNYRAEVQALGAAAKTDGSDQGNVQVIAYGGTP